MITKSRLNRTQLIALLLPGLLLFAAFTVYPIIRLFWMSLCDMSFSSMLTQPFNGIENYKEVFQDQTFWTVFVNSIVYTLITVPGQMAIGLFTAILLNAERDQTIQRNIQSDQLSSGCYIMGNRFIGIPLYFQHGRTPELFPVEGCRNNLIKHTLA